MSLVSESNDADDIEPENKCISLIHSLSASIADKSVEPLEKFAANYKSKSAIPERRRSQLIANDLKELNEQFESLPEADYIAFIKFCNQDIVKPIHEQINATKDALDDQHLCILSTVSWLFTCMIQHHDSSKTVKKMLASLWELLHGMLLSLRGSQDLKLEAQDAISLLCETCWHANFVAKPQLIVNQTLPYLIVRCYELAPVRSAQLHPMRRLYAMRKAFYHLDFEHESSSLLKTIILRCFLQPKLLRAPDSVPFLSFVFEIDTNFIQEINQTIRNQIPNQRKSILRKYGSIYFKAWIASKEPFRREIENCLQQYIHDAAHAGNFTLFCAIRSILSVFFENKRHEGIDKMLYHICSPILWRAIRAANDSVRRQAAILLFDNFPLRDPDFNVEMMDQILQKQFDIAEKLLFDDNPLVRIAAILGVSKILSVYWELIPANVIQHFISKLVLCLANDKSSSSVRATVFEGIRVILDNHQCHAILKPILPVLVPLINDKSERVRLEFVLLLNRIKSIRDLHFYDIVPIDSLLQRMIIDREQPSIRNNLILLFANSYFPRGVSGSSQIARCLAFVEKSPQASIVFYQHIVVHTSVSAVCKVAALLFRWSLSPSKNSQNKAEGNEDKNANEKMESVSSTPIDKIVVLRIIGVLLESVAIQIREKDKFQDCRQFLTKHFSAEKLQTLLQLYGNPKKSKLVTSERFLEEAQCATWTIVAYIGEVVNFTSFLEKLVLKLLSMNEMTGQKVITSVLECLMQWNQFDALVSRVEESLTTWRGNNFAKIPNNNKQHLLHPLVALSIIEMFFERSQSSPAQSFSSVRTNMLQVLENCAHALQAMEKSDLIEVYTKYAIGICKFCDVYVKANCADASVRVFEGAERLQFTRKLSSSDNIEDLEPAALFEAPINMHAFIQWAIDVLLELAKQRLKLSKKRLRKFKANIQEEQITGKGEEFYEQWQRVMAVMTLVLMECAAIGMEVKADSVDDDKCSILQSLMSNYSRALETIDCFDRILCYFGYQILYLIHSSAQEYANLEREKRRLVHALAKMKETHQKECNDSTPQFFQKLIDNSLPQNT